MPVLLLARGDAEAKNLLRQAIEARYGIRPPVIDSLRIDFKGRAKIRLGPLSTWVPVDVTAYFQFPLHMRLDFTVRPAGIALQRGVDAYDAIHYRRARGGRLPAIVEDNGTIQSIRRRLWSFAALLLTPLGEDYVELTYEDERCVRAENTQIKDAVTLLLREDHSLQRVQIKGLNPDTNTEELYSIQLSGEQKPVNDLMLPAQISTFWGDKPEYEMYPVLVEMNPQISPENFSLV